MSQPTPGPWRTGREDMQSYHGQTGQPFSSVYADDDRAGFHLGARLPLVIAIVCGEHIPRSEEKANARLIAAAREMLDLVQRLATWNGDGYPPVSDWATDARALVARIDGKEE